jgi:hypothetical protein
VYYREHATMPDAVSLSSVSSFFYDLPRNPQEKLRSNKALNRTTSGELVGDFISSHSGITKYPI